MKKQSVLLAKSIDSGAALPDSSGTLVGHTRRVLEASETLLEALHESGLADLQELIDWMPLRRLVLAAAGLHDLGKATNIFQGMLRRDKAYRKKIHPVRHEILSALLIAIPESPLFLWADRALNGNEGNFLWMVSWVAGGHHIKLHMDKTTSRTESEKLVRIQGTPDEFTFWGSHPDVNEIIRITCDMAGIPNDVPVIGDMSIPIDEYDDPVIRDLQSIVDDYVESSILRSGGLSEKERISIAFAKAMLVAADVAGSALAREGQEPCSWIRNALSQVLTGEGLQGIIDDSLQGKALRVFQQQIMESQSPVTLTVAGCGNGKTLAAYAWAKQHAVGRKLFFCYPTTGTASAGFEDYLLAQSSLERALIHGRAQVDLERMLETNEDNVFELNQRLESLKAWSHQVVACTTDTVLGLIQNQRLGLFSFPALATAAFVFDEIHNYDSKLFGALLIFLNTFRKTPFLLMSASIPQNRIDALKGVLGERLGKTILGEPQIEQMERYRLLWRTGPSDCWPEVIDALRAGKKVLWVCNTVGHAMQRYDEVLCEGIEPIIYHSRLRYQDRVYRQATVIDLFKKPDPLLVIATQVCEMSLNISADLMVSALAPFPSLIQRLGRLNRYSGGEPGTSHATPCVCLIHDFECLENKPYKAKELEQSKLALSRFWDKPCSQHMLAEILRELQQKEEIQCYSAWLDGKWQSDQRPLRSGGASLTVLLEKDLTAIKEKLGKEKPTSQNVAAWTIPMLYNPDMLFAQQLGGYPVAGEDDIDYHEAKGAQWKREAWRIY